MLRSQCTAHHRWARLGPTGTRGYAMKTRWFVVFALALVGAALAMGVPAQEPKADEQDPVYAKERRDQGAVAREGRPGRRRHPGHGRREEGDPDRERPDPCGAGARRAGGSRRRGDQVRRQPAEARSARRRLHRADGGGRARGRSPRIQGQAAPLRGSSARGRGRSRSKRSTASSAYAARCRTPHASRSPSTPPPRPRESRRSST